MSCPLEPSRLGVVKVGGSLLDWPSLPARLDAWLDARRGETRLLLLAGGGAKVDAIRHRQERSGTSDEVCHWKAIAAMEENTRELNRLLAAPLPMVESTTLFAKLGTPAAWFLPLPWAQRQSDVPASWETTSDSLAARLALELGKETSSPACLTLLKSRSLGPFPDSRGGAAPNWNQLAKEGAVDRAFPAYAGKIAAIEWIHFRDPRWERLRDQPSRFFRKL